jgi:hypothetical protein
MIRKDRTASLQLLGSSFDWKSLFSSMQMCFIRFWPSLMPAFDDELRSDVLEIYLLHWRSRSEQSQLG